MKVLITSGGTKISIDSVRSITNMSNGTLGSRLARKALENNNEVIFFRAEKSKSPMSITLDLTKQNLNSAELDAEDVINFYKCYSHRYTDITYKTFEDYQAKLQQIIALYKPDMIILAAAVSDYAPETVMNGKIRTNGDLNIPLKPLPKVISNVMEWAGPKAKIVGFKLLVNVPDSELIEAAKESLIKNKLDFVCANDLTTLLKGDHKIHVISEGEIKLKDIMGSCLWEYLSGQYIF